MLYMTLLKAVLAFLTHSHEKSERWLHCTLYCACAHQLLCPAFVLWPALLLGSEIRIIKVELYLCMHVSSNMSSTCSSCMSNMTAHYIIMILHSKDLVHMLKYHITTWPVKVVIIVELQYRSLTESSVGSMTASLNALLGSIWPESLIHHAMARRSWMRWQL